MVDSWSDSNENLVSQSARRPELLLSMFAAGNTCVVHVTGELDLATRDQLVSTSTGGDHPAMVIDLGGVTFMDCSGYGSLVACRHAIEGEGRSIAIEGQTGQPARLLRLIAGFETGADADVRPTGQLAIPVAQAL